MKQLIIPIVIAILAGVGGGSGFAYMRASKAFVADSSQRADSVKATPPATVVEHDSATTHAPLDSVAVGVPMPVHDTLTPADSIRALVAARATLKADTKGLPDATPVAPTKVEAIAEPHATVKPLAKVEALQASLPEQRLAKIFGAMQAKEASKVLEQMTDSDVRTILSMMSDRQAAAILASFSAQRAAIISKGTVRAPEAKPESKPEGKPEGKPELKPAVKP